MRLDKAEYEMSFASQFDKIIINDNLETAKEEIYKVVNDFIKVWTDFIRFIAVP